MTKFLMSSVLTAIAIASIISSSSDESAGCMVAAAATGAGSCSFSHQSCTKSFVSSKSNNNMNNMMTMMKLRGGDSDAVVEETTAAAAADEETAVSAAKDDGEDDEISFEDKVHAAMAKFGLSSEDIASTAAATPATSSDDVTATDEVEMECEGGVCKPKTTAETTETTEKVNQEESMEDTAKRLSEEFNVNTNIAMAALVASRTPITTVDNDSTDATTTTTPEFDEQKAREIIQYEIDALSNTSNSSEELDEMVSQLESEGFQDSDMIRRALALTDMNMDDARAVLLAEQEDEELEQQQIAEQQKQMEEQEKPMEMKTVSVDANFDPTQPAAASTAAARTAPPTMPAVNKPAQIYKCTTSEVQKLILESPIPVLLDIYTDWCGPCQQLTPALEEMCRKSNGLFRLVKINADEEKGLVSSVLKVTGYPTLFGIRDAKIINRSVGAPRSEEGFRSFMMEMVSGNPDNEELSEMTTKLIKMAGSASLPFSLRERMQTKTQQLLEKMLNEDCEGDMLQAENIAKKVRMLLSNVIAHPTDPKYRVLKLNHPVLNCVATSKCGKSILKTAGFVTLGDVALNEMKLKVENPQAKVINVAPLNLVRDCIDKWMDVNRYEIAKAARKRKEDEDRIQLAKELEAQELEEDEYDDEEESEDEQDPNISVVKVRLDGKKKVHEVEFQKDTSVQDVISQLTSTLDFGGEEIQLICASKRLILNSEETRTLEQVGIYPSGSIVLKKAASGSGVSSATKSSSIADRAKARKKKTGSHTMQSIGIYAKDDNAKGELIDGGNGVWYEHDVSSDDEEGVEEEKEDVSAEEESISMEGEEDQEYNDDDEQTNSEEQ